MYIRIFRYASNAFFIFRVNFLFFIKAGGSPHHLSVQRALIGVRYHSDFHLPHAPHYQISGLIRTPLDFFLRLCLEIFDFHRGGCG